MEDKTQIFQFTPLCIILFCWTNWRFMKWHILIWYDMIWQICISYLSMLGQPCWGPGQGGGSLWVFNLIDYMLCSSSGLWTWTVDGLVAPSKSTGVAQPGYIIWVFPVCLLVYRAGFIPQLNRRDLWTPQPRELQAMTFSWSASLPFCWVWNQNWDVGRQRNIS